MALTVEMDVNVSGVGGFPDGYTPPTLTQTFGVNNVVKLPRQNFVIPGSNGNASAATGLTNVVTALQTAVTNFLGDGAGQGGLDDTNNTIQAEAKIVAMKRRAYDPAQESMFNVGGDFFVCTVEIKYEITA